MTQAASAIILLSSALGLVVVTISFDDVASWSRYCLVCTIKTIRYTIRKPHLTLQQLLILSYWGWFSDFFHALDSRVPDNNYIQVPGVLVSPRFLLIVLSLYLS